MMDARSKSSCLVMVNQMTVSLIAICIGVYANAIRITHTD